MAEPDAEVDAEVDALQTTLAAEHAAVYVLGAVGGRTSRSAMPALYAAVSAAYAAHRARRDQLTGVITDLGATPVAAEPAYELPPRLETDDQLARAALDVERRCAATYAYLVAETVAERRRWAITALNEAAVRELAFRGTPETFPGNDEYADR
jgi:hypothetical protein